MHATYLSIPLSFSVTFYYHSEDLIHEDVYLQKRATSHYYIIYFDTDA